MSAFTVRVYPEGSSSMVVVGGSDPMGLYIETRPHAGQGYTATPAFRISVDKSALKPLPPGSDADFEYPFPIPASAFRD